MEDKRKVLRKNADDSEFSEINFADIQRGDIIHLVEADGEPVVHEDGRDTYIATSDAYLNELGLLMFEFDDEPSYQ